MRCDYPQIVLKAGTKDKKGKIWNKDVEVKCGKCYNCKISRLRSWIFRLQQEHIASTSSYFVTLTYDNEHVPITQNGFLTLVKKDVQDYIKRLRVTQSSKNKIVYLAVGEYGSYNKRPHYHLLLFNVQKEIEIDQQWGKGNVFIGGITQKSIAYTLEYITLYRKKEPEHARHDIIPEFQLQSTGIGKSWLTSGGKKHLIENIEKMFINLPDGTKIGVPRYYRQIALSEEQRNLQARIAQESEAEQLAKDILKHGYEVLDRAKKARLDKLLTKKSKKS